MARYLQGRFVPRNPEKYVGNVNNIIYRSSWEKKMFVRLDQDPTFLKWSSEELVIPYVSPVDGKVHRYFPDFIMEYKTRTGEIKRAVCEIKPFAQTISPKIPKRQNVRYLTEVATYAVNQEKWKQARVWAERNKMDFVILTENDLGISQLPKLKRSSRS